MIKAAKRANYAILGNADISDEEILTAFTGAETLVNSRPLTYQSANPQDETPLLPNHFLIGQLGEQLAPGSVDKTDFVPENDEEEYKNYCCIFGIAGSENGYRV